MRASLSLEFAAIFWLIGLSLAYLPAWLQAHGLDSVQIGAILGLAFWATALVLLFASGKFR